MAIFNKEGLLVTKKGAYQVDELISKLSFVHHDYLVDFLQSIGLSVPRKLRMSVLKDLLKDLVSKTIEERKSLADEMGYRLTWFNRFTDSQLVNLLEWYKSTSLGNHYLSNFWKALLNYMVEKGVGDEDLESLFKEANNAAKAHKRPLTKDFNKALNKVLFDVLNEIDGVSQEQFRPVTYKATTLSELRAIGDKYNAPIPKRLKKNEMLEVIFDKLKERKELTPDLEAKLRTLNIILLERFAKDNDIKVSTELKKEEIIEFILSNAEETKSAYFVPQSQVVYEKEEPKVDEVVQEDAPVKEQQPTPVEPVVQKTVLMNSEAIDYRPELDKLADAFQNLAKSFDSKEFVFKIDNHLPQQEAENPQQVPERPQVDPVIETNEEPVQKNLNPSSTMISQEFIVQELLKEEEDLDLPKINPDEPVDLGKAKLKTVFKYRKGLGIFIACFALLLSALFTWIALVTFNILPVPLDIPFLEDLAMQYAVSEDLVQNVIKFGSIGLALINLLVFFRLLMKPKKRDLIFWGVLTLFTGPVLIGILILLTIGKAEVQVDDEETNETVRLAEAIENIWKSSKK